MVNRATDADLARDDLEDKTIYCSDEKARAGVDISPRFSERRLRVAA